MCDLAAEECRVPASERRVCLSAHLGDPTCNSNPPSVYATPYRATQHCASRKTYAMSAHRRKPMSHAGGWCEAPRWCFRSSRCTELVQCSASRRISTKRPQLGMLPALHCANTTPTHSSVSVLPLSFLTIFPLRHRVHLESIRFIRHPNAVYCTALYTQSPASPSPALRRNTTASLSRPSEGSSAVNPCTALCVALVIRHSNLPRAAVPRFYQSSHQGPKVVQ